MLANRYFALIDILGFSKMLEQCSVDNVVNEVQKLLGLSEPPIDSTMLWTPSNAESTREEGLEIGRYHFSDTLLFWSQPVDSSDAEFEVHISMHFYHFLAELVSRALFQRIPLRGAVAFGATFADPVAGIVVGRPVVDAYRLEQAQEWIGIALHNSCLARPLHKEVGFFIVRYSIPLKKGATVESAAAIDWTTPLRVSAQNFERLRGFNPRERFAAVMVEAPREDPGVAAKYSNTEKFLLDMQRHRPIQDALGFIGDSESRH
jgi:hypothetical protein